MFTRLFITLLCVAIAPAFASVVTDNVPVPILLTSAVDHLFTSRQLLDAAPSISHLLHALRKQDTSIYVNASAPAVERIVILAYPELSVSDFSKHYSHFIYLLPALKEAQSSMLYHDESFLSQINSISPLFESLKEVDCMAAMSECANSLAALRDSESTTTELVIVHVSPASDAASLKAILPISKSASTVLIVTSAHSHPHSMSFEAASYQDSEFVDVSVPSRNTSWNPHPISNYTNATVYSLWLNNSNGTLEQIWLGPQYVTPNIFFGLLLGLFFLFILYHAIACMLGIQRPVRLSPQTLSIPKEY